MIKLVIRADDIGYSEAVNYGIEKSVKDGLIRSAGLMPNMPFAEHGLKLLEGTGIAIGLKSGGSPFTSCTSAASVSVRHWRSIQSSVGKRPKAGWSSSNHVPSIAQGSYIGKYAELQYTGTNRPRTAPTLRPV